MKDKDYGASLKGSGVEGADVVATGASGFNPDWTVAPGSTLREWREENGLSAHIVANMCRLDFARYKRIEAGQAPITRTVACKLQQGTFIPARFWLNFERLYRQGLAAGKKVT